MLLDSRTAVCESDVCLTAFDVSCFARSRDGKQKSVEVQTSIADGHWQYGWEERFVGRPIVPPSLGLGSVDPSPIATHVVSADTLESRRLLLYRISL